MDNAFFEIHTLFIDRVIWIFYIWICIILQCPPIHIQLLIDILNTYTDEASCHTAKINFFNSFKSDIICKMATDSSQDTACFNAEISITPKNHSSTIFIDMQSRFGSNIKIDVNYEKNEPFVNDYIIENKTNLITTNHDSTKAARHPPLSMAPGDMYDVSIIQAIEPDNVPSPVHTLSRTSLPSTPTLNSCWQPSRKGFARVPSKSGD